MQRSSCKIDGCNNPAWSGGLCKNHAARKPLKKNIPQKKEENMLHVFFMEIWKERPHYSEISGTYLGKEPMSTYFHHILPKSKYPEAEYEKSNIILLTLDEHTKVESDMYAYPEINVRRELLLNRINQ